MTLRQYLTTVGLATLMVWVLTAVIVLSVNPFEAPSGVVGVFYACLFLALAGTFSLAGFVVRLGILGKRDLVSFQVFVAFRQAILLALLSVALLYLRSQDRLHWLSILALVGGLTVLEFVFISVRLQRR